MRRALLDVNVLLALLDSDHADHVRATAWLDRDIDGGWATCAITENGFVRVLSQPRYPSPVSPAIAVDLLALAVAHGGRLVTFDRGLALSTVKGATSAHLLVL